MVRRLWVQMAVLSAVLWQASIAGAQQPQDRTDPISVRTASVDGLTIQYLFGGHGPTIVLGTVVVGALLTAMAALSFSAVVKITTENFMATHAFTPVATLLVQIAASAVGLIPGYALDPGLVPAMVGVDLRL